MNTSNIISYDTVAPPSITKTTYELLPLYNEKNPMLNQKQAEFNFEKPPQPVVHFANQMLHTMAHYGGVGLAAPQCGFPYRMFVMVGGIVCINPVILRYSKETAFVKEGCLSFPGLYFHVTRPETIEIEYTNEFGKRITVQWTGATARIAQHEFDHLEGKLYTSLVGNLTLQMARKKKEKLFKKIKRHVQLKEQHLRMTGKDQNYTPTQVVPTQVQSNRVT
jgi:peptide deformylase